MFKHVSNPYRLLTDKAFKAYTDINPLFLLHDRQTGRYKLTGSFESEGTLSEIIELLEDLEDEWEQLAEYMNEAMEGRK